MSVDVLAPAPALPRGLIRTLPALTLWRGTIALSAATGVVLAALRYDVWWTALSQLANVAVALAYAGLAVWPHLRRSRGHEPDSPWLRGALATLMLLVSGAYLVMTGGDLSTAYSLFEHLVTPALVVADWFLVGSNQHAVRWWHPLTWLVPPAAYLAWYVTGDLRVYVALDPSQREFVAEVGALMMVVLASGTALYAHGRSCRRYLQPAVVRVESPARVPESVAAH